MIGKEKYMVQVGIRSIACIERYKGYVNYWHNLIDEGDFEGLEMRRCW